LLRITRGASAEIARLEALRFRAIAEFDNQREHSRGVPAEIAIALSVTDEPGWTTPPRR
jgi:hypothetical protein